MNELHRVVLYTQDFEPITVVALPHWAMERLEKWRDPIRLAVPPDVASMRWVPSKEIADIELRTILIYPHRLNWYGREMVVLVTHDEVDALRMPLEPLPGQRAGLQNYERTVKALTDMLIETLGRT